MRLQEHSSINRRAPARKGISVEPFLHLRHVNSTCMLRPTACKQPRTRRHSKFSARFKVLVTSIPVYTKRCRRIGGELIRDDRNARSEALQTYPALLRSDLSDSV
ncbi:TPA: hypothetical protein ACH3X3_015122 [Trebouxia sp. C0006]